MEHSISLSEDRSYVVLRLRGEIRGRAAVETNLEAHSFGREHGVHRYLVDARECRNVDTVFGNYEFAYKDMRLAEGIDRNARIAVLVSPGDHSHDFVETVSRNSGLDVTLFTDLELALRHLSEER
ncbi:MAG: hypothetical protein ABIK65_11875 [Candidatus Eisenbacteria bacterium]